MSETISHSELLRLLDYNPETGIFRWKVTASGRAKAGNVAGSIGGNGYRRIRIFGTEYLAHRLAWFYVKGDLPPSDLDHKDGSKINNRFSNLRVSTVSQNAANRRLPATNTTGFKGIRARANDRWRAAIEHNGKHISLGTYGSKEEAHAAYCEAAQRLFGEFARAA